MRCAPGTAAYEASVQRFDNLRVQLENLEPGDNLAEVREGFDALTSGDCYRFSDVRTRGPGFENANAIIDWVRGGGLTWLYSFLEPIRNGSNVSTVWIPPSERRILSRESPGSFPLRSLLCSESAPECGTETRGWIARANHAFREQRDREDESRRREATRPENQNTQRERIEQCGQSTADLPRQERYAAWYDCVHSLHPIYSLLPLGHFRMPRRGWLVIRGRRGHYGFCDEVRAYDLATGAAHIISSCSRLILERDGTVDGEQTNRGRTQEVTSGRMPLEALREAALLIFLAPETQRYLVPDAIHIPDIPANLERSWATSETGLGYSGMGLSGWFNSGQTSLRWSYIAEGRERAQGRLTWPVAAHEGQNHAASLLATAERGLVQGCAPANIPPNLPHRTHHTEVPGLGALWRTLVSASRVPCQTQADNQ